MFCNLLKLLSSCLCPLSMGYLCCAGLIRKVSRVDVTVLSEGLLDCYYMRLLLLKSCVKNCTRTGKEIISCCCSTTLIYLRNISGFRLSTMQGKKAICNR